VARQLSLGSETLLATAGVDEAGRGPLAGPVVAAAVILDDERPIPELADSKRLTPKQRSRVARAVRAEARAFAVALAEPAEIDSINVLEASLLAMSRAIAKLSIVPGLVRVDGTHTPRYSSDRRPFEIEAVVRGDQSVPAISAASILAKVCRDRLMRRWHRRFPVYGFDQHKGYPTRAHIAALAAHGPCPIHRRTFGPVRDCLEVAS
jgi:ribonuclease HII